ncbi:MAG TPA: MFS transporter [Desulfobacterales bacterium]|nr:MFS transporter [Desulfobacterales bacterium]
MSDLSSKHPRFFWGWVVVVGGFVLMAVSYGARYSFGVFVQPLTVENGWSRSVISATASINLLAYAVGGILSGRLLDRFAPRWVATAGTVVGAAGFLLCAWVTSPIGLYLAYGVLYGFGSSWTGTVVVNSSVGKWFVERRGIAIGIASMGVSFGTITITPVAAWLIERFSWQAGFLGMGGLLLVLGTLVAQVTLVRTVPEAYGLRPDGRPRPAPQPRPPAPQPRPPVLAPASKGIRGDSRFWLLVACHGTAVMAAMMAFVHQVPYAIDNGIERLAAAASLSVMGVSGLIGQFFFGWVSDRVGDPKRAAVLGYLVMASGTALLLYSRTPGVLYAYAVVFGFGYGCLGPLLPIIAADRFGRLNIGAVFGLLTFFVVGVGGAVGPVLGGLVYDLTGSYRAAWIMNLALLILSAAGIATLRRRPLPPPTA